MKTDYKKVLKQLYVAKTGHPVVVDVPKLNYIMIDGVGDPNTSQDYTDAIQALYAVAYRLKFVSKSNGHDFAVMPLEGLWWSDDMANFAAKQKQSWSWTMMIMQPDAVTVGMYEGVVEDLRAKKQLAALGKMRLATYDEGRSAQVLYVGPYDGEGDTIQELHDFIAGQGGQLDGPTKYHHEIYLSDPRRVDPTRLKTIIRQPY